MTNTIETDDLCKTTNPDFLQNHRLISQPPKSRGIKRASYSIKHALYSAVSRWQPWGEEKRSLREAGRRWKPERDWCVSSAAQWHQAHLQGGELDLSFSLLIMAVLQAGNEAGQTAAVPYPLHCSSLRNIKPRKDLCIKTPSILRRGSLKMPCMKWITDQ